MKKILFGLIFLMGSFGAFAQDASAAFKAAKDAYNKAKTLKGAEKTALVKEAFSNIDAAYKGVDGLDPKLAGKLLKFRGEIYNATTTEDIQMKTISGQAVTDYNSGAKAFESYQKLYETAAKKGAKRSAMSGMVSAVENIRNLATIAYQDKAYAASHDNFVAVTKAYSYVKDNGGKVEVINGETGKKEDMFPTENDLNQNLLYAMITASLAEQTDKMCAIANQLYEAKYNDPSVYTSVFNCTKGTDEKKAVEILDAGRKAFPEDESLLIAEINYFMQAGKLDELLGKLEKAIELDPTNVSYYSALGGTYDQLAQNETKAKNDAKSNEYFEKAMANYDKAIEIDAKNSNLYYAKGALYYNRAATMTQELKAMDGDYSKAGLAKQEALSKKIDAEFEKAIPFFKQAEQINPNDLDTLNALKAYYARIEKFDISNEFKSRIETVQGGGKVEKSYFAQ